MSLDPGTQTATRPAPPRRPSAASDPLVSTDPPTPSRPGRARQAALIVPLLAGSAVAVALGVYGSLHTPTGVSVHLPGFSSPLAAKAWLATAATVLAVVQLLSALALYGRIGTCRARHGYPTHAWVAPLHRWSGRLAFLCAVPVALHCLYALGAQSATPRVLLHSAFGCFFFGAFTAKMLLLRVRGLPRWALPLAGGLVFTVLVGIWLTSSLWFFQNVGLTF